MELQSYNGLTISRNSAIEKHGERVKKHKKLRKKRETKKKYAYSFRSFSGLSWSISVLKLENVNYMK